MRNTLIVLAGFVLYYIGFKHFEEIMLFINKAIHYGLASYFLTYIIIGVPMFVATCVINNDRNFFKWLGLQANVVTGLLAGAIFALPMFIGSFLQSSLAEHVSVPDLIAKTILAGFFEELYFRGFFYGQLFRKTKLGFFPSILLCSLIFASGHLYQSHDPGILFGVFITTFMGSVLFAWLYTEWNYNLWVPVFLHTFMNLSWYLFSVSNNALGNVNSNLYRGITIALAVGLTLWYKKRKGQKLLVNRNTLLMKREGV